MNEALLKNTNLQYGTNPTSKPQDTSKNGGERSVEKGGKASPQVSKFCYFNQYNKDNINRIVEHFTVPSHYRDISITCQFLCKHLLSPEKLIGLLSQNMENIDKFIQTYPKRVLARNAYVFLKSMNTFLAKMESNKQALPQNSSTVIPPLTSVQTTIPKEATEQYLMTKLLLEVENLYKEISIWREIPYGKLVGWTLAPILIDIGLRLLFNDFIGANAGFGTGYAIIGTLTTALWLLVPSLLVIWLSDFRWNPDKYIVGMSLLFCAAALFTTPFRPTYS